MSTLKFAETHNLVAFLEKPKESNGFEGIIDFLNASSIKYALTVNPTVYESCIKQFWATAKAKTVNGERQIQALVDKKKVIITKKSVRSDLMLEDAKGTECLPNDVIFEQLTLMGAKTTAWNEFSSTMASAIILLVYAARHLLIAVRHKLMLPGITYHCWFLATAKVKTVNGERQIQALVDKKRVIITETSIRSDLKLEDAEGIDSWNEFSSTMASAIICLATNKKFNFSNYIFDNMVKNLEGGVKFLMYPRFVQVFLDKQVEGMSKHKGIYVTPSHTKKIFANMKREGKGLENHPSISNYDGSSSKRHGRKQRNENGPTESILDEATNEEPISTLSYDPPQSGKDRLQLTELMNLCTKLQQQVLDLEEAKTAQAKEIASLKKRVKQLEKIRKSRPLGLNRLRNFGLASRVESSNDVSLGSQEDASKHGRKIADLDVDKEVTLIDETQKRNDEEMLFDVQDDLQGEEVVAEKEVIEKDVSAADPVTTAGEVVTTANVEVTTASALTTTIDELTLAQTLIEIKVAKPKAVTTAATTTTNTRTKARWVVVQEPSEFKTTSSPLQASQLPQAKDKGKEIMVEPEKPLKKKDQIAIDKEVARNLEAQLQAELEEEERHSRLKEEEANIALLESWDNT
ncbi:hypothetical protein Tco_0317096 [Tanacetum coccineum]